MKKIIFFSCLITVLVSWRTIQKYSCKDNTMQIEGNKSEINSDIDVQLNYNTRGRKVIVEINGNKIELSNSGAKRLFSVEHSQKEKYTKLGLSNSFVLKEGENNIKVYYSKSDGFFSDIVLTMHPINRGYKYSNCLIIISEKEAGEKSGIVKNEKNPSKFSPVIISDKAYGGVVFFAAFTHSEIKVKLNASGDDLGMGYTELAVLPELPAGKNKLEITFTLDKLIADYHKINEENVEVFIKTPHVEKEISTTIKLGETIVEYVDLY